MVRYRRDAPFGNYAASRKPIRLESLLEEFLWIVVKRLRVPLFLSDCNMP